MQEKLNIETFNKILFEAIGEDKRVELLEAELQTAYGMKIQHMEELVKALNENRPYKDILETINNVDANCDKINRMLEKEREKMQES